VYHSLEAKILIALDMRGELKDQKYKNLPAQTFGSLCQKRSFKDMFNEKGLGKDYLKDLHEDQGKIFGSIKHKPKYQF
jgi:hypothetical protein